VGWARWSVVRLRLPAKIKGGIVLDGLLTISLGVRGDSVDSRRRNNLRANIVLEREGWRPGAPLG
jgi:hypothetical protein